MTGNPLRSPKPTRKKEDRTFCKPISFYMDIMGCSIGPDIPYSQSTLFSRSPPNTCRLLGQTHTHSQLYLRGWRVGPVFHKSHPEFLKSLNVIGLSWLTRVCNVVGSLEQRLWISKLGWQFPCGGCVPATWSSHSLGYRNARVISDSRGTMRFFSWLWKNSHQF